MEKLERLCTVGVIFKWGSCYGKWYANSSKNLKIKLLDDPAIPLLDRYLKELESGFRRDICTPVFIPLFKIAKRWKKPKCPLMDELGGKKAVYTYNGVVFSLRKRGNSDMCYNSTGY